MSHEKGNLVEIEKFSTILRNGCPQRAPSGPPSAPTPGIFIFVEHVEQKVWREKIKTEQLE